MLSLKQGLGVSQPHTLCVYGVALQACAAHALLQHATGKGGQSSTFVSVVLPGTQSSCSTQKQQSADASRGRMRACLNIKGLMCIRFMSFETVH